jgi:hypothetical protein
VTLVYFDFWFSIFLDFDIGSNSLHSAPFYYRLMLSYHQISIFLSRHTHHIDRYTLFPLLRRDNSNHRRGETNISLLVSAMANRKLQRVGLEEKVAEKLCAPNVTDGTCADFFAKSASQLGLILDMNRGSTEEVIMQVSRRIAPKPVSAFEILRRRQRSGGKDLCTVARSCV